MWMWFYEFWWFPVMVHQFRILHIYRLSHSTNKFTCGLVWCEVSGMKSFCHFWNLIIKVDWMWTSTVGPYSIVCLEPWWRWWQWFSMTIKALFKTFLPCFLIFSTLGCLDCLWIHLVGVTWPSAAGDVEWGVTCGQPLVKQGLYLMETIYPVLNDRRCSQRKSLGAWYIHKLRIFFLHKKSQAMWLHS